MDIIYLDSGGSVGIDWPSRSGRPHRFDRSDAHGVHIESCEYTGPGSFYPWWAEQAMNILGHSLTFDFDAAEERRKAIWAKALELLEEKEKEKESR
jgi:hypothetical protein